MPPVPTFRVGSECPCALPAWLRGCSSLLPVIKNLCLHFGRELQHGLKILFPEGADETVFPREMPWDRSGPQQQGRVGPSQQLHLVLVISVSFNDHVLTCSPSASLGRPGLWGITNR